MTNYTSISLLTKAKNIVDRLLTPLPENRPISKLDINRIYRYLDKYTKQEEELETI